MFDLLVAFVLGALVCHFAHWLWALPRTPKPPPPPACTACLRSGQDCKFNLGHAGPHRASFRVSSDPLDGYQEYVWEDPQAGVHPVEFRLVPYPKKP